MDKKILHWSYLNIKDIPLDLYLYEELNELYLKENYISTIPKWFLNLNNLTFVHLGGNQITEIPEEIYLLDNLEFFDLSNNRLTEIPPTIGFVFNLVQLNVSDNELTAIPKGKSILFLYSVNKYSSVYCCNLEIGNLRKLEHLNISKNKLTRLPVEISTCVRLIELNLNDNPDVWHIPERISRIASLQHLFADRKIFSHFTYLDFF